MFCDKCSAWGFTTFMPLADVLDLSFGFLRNDTLVVCADVQVKRVVEYCSWDSKKETGYVGLKNQGATGSINVLLQSLYHVPYFRKVAPFFLLNHHVLLDHYGPSLSAHLVFKAQRPGTCLQVVQPITE
jgi:hypothetical protein